MIFASKAFLSLIISIDSAPTIHSIWSSQRPAPYLQFLSYSVIYLTSHPSMEHISLNSKYSLTQLITCRTWIIRIVSYLHHCESLLLNASADSYQQLFLYSEYFKNMNQIRSLCFFLNPPRASIPHGIKPKYRRLAVEDVCDQSHFFPLFSCLTLQQSWQFHGSFSNMPQVVWTYCMFCLGHSAWNILPRSSYDWVPW